MTSTADEDRLQLGHTASQHRFDWWALAGVAIGFVGTVGLASLLPMSRDETLVSGGVATLNHIILERYSYEFERKPIVLVGSSLLTYVPPWNCRPDDVANLYLQGRSASTGLAAVLRAGAHPAVVFVEVTTAVVKADHELLGEVFDPVYWRVQAAVPALRKSRNWFVLLYGWFTFRKAPETSLEFPHATTAEWDRMFEPQWRELYRDAHDDRVTPGVAELAHLVREAQRRGVRVVLYDPIDPRLHRFSPSKDLRREMRAALPDLLWIDAPDGEMPLYRRDWWHLEPASGLRFFNYLMRRAGLSVKPKCTIQPQVAN